MTGLNRAIIFSLMAIAGTAHAYEPERARANFAHELADCSAYYMLSARISKAQLPDIATKLEAAGVQASELSAGLSNEKVALARMQIATKDMLKDIDNDAGNFSILLNKYSDACGDILRDPGARTDYWLNK